MRLRRNKILLLPIVAVLAVTILYACDDSTTTATSITLSKMTLEMEIGETDTLKATVVPTTASIQTVTWSTSDSTVCTVDQNGVVTAVDFGEARIWASAQDGTPVKTGCTVDVIDPDEEVVDSASVAVEDSLGVDAEN